MFLLELKPKVVKFIKTLPPKHQRQIKNYILMLQHDSLPTDVTALMGHPPYVRADVGEYRIIYKTESKEKLITIVLVGKRNDGEVYRIAKRIL